MNKVSVRSGLENLPKILVLAGLHGNELTAMATAYRLQKETLDNFQKRIWPDITIINCINRYGLRHNTRNSGYESDQFDLNRVYGEEKPEVIRQEIADEIDNADILIDIHSSPRMIDALFLVDNNTKYCRKLLEKYCNLPIVVQSKPKGITAKQYASMNGKLALTLETNGMEIIDYNAVEKAIYAINGIVCNAPAFMEEFKNETMEHRSKDRLFSHIESDISGFITWPQSAPYITPDDEIEVRDVLGGDVTSATYKIPEDSFCVELHERDYINAGEELVGYMPK